MYLTFDQADGRLRRSLAYILRALWQKGLLAKPDLVALPVEDAIRKELQSGDRLRYEFRASQRSRGKDLWARRS